MQISMHNVLLLLKRATIFVALFILALENVSAQSTFFSDLEGALVDLVFISDNYVSPAATASVYQSTSSFFSSARSLELFEFDVSAHVNILPVPNKQKSFTVRDSDFVSFKIRGATAAEVPTVLGDGTEVFYDFELDGEAFEIQTFEGANQNTFYYPYIQGSVGLWKQTELTVQYVPEIRINDSGYRTFGGAIKHNISQYWLDDVASDTSFQLAAQVAYSSFNYDVLFDDFEVRRTDPEPGDEPLAVINTLSVDANAFTSQLIGSKRIKNLEFVGSFAVLVNKFDYTLGGDGELFLNLLNDAFEGLEDASTLVKGSVGVNYHFEKWYIASNITLGTFLNTNISAHYVF